MFDFDPPADDGGGAITGYAVYCSPGNVSATRFAAPITVTGLANGVQHTCWATATNSIGESAPSDPVSVTPVASALALLAVQSRKLHGATSFDLEIDAGQPIAGAVTVEPRSGAAGHQVVFQFNAPISAAGSATVADANANPVGSASVSAATNEVIVSLTAIPDTSRVTVSLSGVNGSGAASASLAFLLGDVRESRTVTSGDILPTKARAGQAANSANFLYDVDLNGTVGASDLLAIKARAGSLIP